MPKTSVTSAIVFDLDGILLDTEPAYTDATAQVLREYGKSYGWELKARMMGRCSKESAELLVRELGLPLSGAEYLERRRPLLERAFPGVAPLPGAPELVTSLSERGVPLAVATSSERSLYELKVERHSWFVRFRAVVCGDDPRVSRPKPAPDIFFLAARDLGVAPESCLVFEDSPAGVEAALAAGMRVIALPAPELGAHHFAGAERIVRSYSELDPMDLGLA